MACTSWPQACATPGDGAGPRVVGAVVDRQRVEVGAQGDERARSPARCRRSGRCAAARRTRRPASSRRLAITPVVRSSAHDSSGWACRSRRSSISSSSSFSIVSAIRVLGEDMFSSGYRRSSPAAGPSIKWTRRRVISPQLRGFDTFSRPISCQTAAIARLRQRARPVVRREDAVGGHGRGELAGQHGGADLRRGPRRPRAEWRSRCSSSSRTSAQVKSSCWSARLRGQPVRAEVLAVGEHALPDVVDPGVLQRRAGHHRRRPARRDRGTRRSAPASSRGGRPGPPARGRRRPC